MKWSGAKPGSRALDVCCGTGDLALLLAKTVTTSGEVCVRSYKFTICTLQVHMHADCLVQPNNSYL